VTCNGPVAWIGTIWVDQAWRRKGMGRALTLATMEAGAAAGCRTYVLVATKVGQPLYEGLGFEVQTWYHIKEAPGLAADADPPRAPTEPGGHARRFRPSDLPAMTGLDRAATGEDRGHLLAAFATPETALCLDRADGSLGGFVIRAPWGGGATIAPDQDDAMAVLTARRLAAGPDKRVRAGVLTENEAGRERLAADGWTDVWQGPRMILGPTPDWTPSSIWGQFDHAIG
jgi:ribosomal protein S18 acetylase RimI-like enzyme